MSHDPNGPINPYAPVALDAPQDAPLSHAEEIRKKYLSHEASVKSIGVLFFIGAIIQVPAGLFMIGLSINAFFTGAASIESPAFVLGVGVFELILGIVQGMTAVALHKLKNWARVVATIFSTIGLLGFPLGTLISAYFLYLLASSKGIYVFSDEYRRVITATPGMKYKTSIVAWVLLGLFVALIAFVMIVAWFA